jgi:hypothetical protein
MAAILNDVQHSIHIPGFQYELGVKQVAGQWQIIGDWWGDIRALLGPQAKDTCPLIQAYGIEAAIAEAHRQGLPVREEVDQEGTVKIHATILE